MHIRWAPKCIWVPICTHARLHQLAARPVPLQVEDWRNLKSLSDMCTWCQTLGEMGQPTVARCHASGNIPAYHTHRMCVHGNEHASADVASVNMLIASHTAPRMLQSTGLPHVTSTYQPQFCAGMRVVALAAHKQERAAYLGSVADGGAIHVGRRESAVRSPAIHSNAVTVLARYMLAHFADAVAPVRRCVITAIAANLFHSTAL